MMFHPLHTDLPRPQVLNNPFCYEPAPLCRLAAEGVKSYVATRHDWRDEVEAGKMFGVLVCEDADGTLGFLAAYSGQIQGREDHEWFVPAVFDYLQPDGYFKQEEVRISVINERISEAKRASDYVSAQVALSRLQAEADREIAAYKAVMQEAKRRRDAIRAEQKQDAPVLIGEDGQADMAVLIKESQFQKAELHRLKQRWRTRLDEASARVRPYADRIAALSQERHRRSDALQRWLFDHFEMMNAQGERRSLTDIFSSTPQQLPPAGAGECCAPKLLQYAFMHRLRPLCMAEFWQGRSPRMEVRHHDHYYPACQGKCKPILEWMLETLPRKTLPWKTLPRKTLPLPLPVREGSGYIQRLEVYTPLPHREGLGESLLVINKPAGLLSVPGKSGEPSVESILRRRYPGLHIVHRLDMDTSGLMVIALTDEAYHHLQRQFERHTIYKRYVALLDGEVHGSGTISLPLRPDLDDRPRQLVDHQHGKEAVTDYEVLGHHDGYTRIALVPHTGRTHQLRMHCAHAEGLGVPILGDPLYGRKADRLYLHAETLVFEHPVTGQRMAFTAPAPY